MSKSRKLVQEKPSVFYILPIAFVIAVVPLIVFMKMYPVSPIESINWYGESLYTDFFNYYKSQWLLIGSILAVFFYLVHAIAKGFNYKKSFIYIPTFIYTGLVILSTMTSKYMHIAVSGFVARYEGMISLLCYVALMLITFNLVRAESQMRFIFGALLISSSVVALVGFLQFIGFDLYRKEFGRLLILPVEYHKIEKELSFLFADKVVFSTFSNSNYIGSYMALVVPIAILSCFLVKNRYLKIGSALLSVILLICLFGSRSRAGFIGFAVSVLAAVIIFRKLLFKKKLPVILAGAGIVVMFFGVNFALKGLLVDRLLSIFQSTADQYFDLQDITFGDNSVSIVGPNETLVIKKSEESRLYFFDGYDNSLDYDMEETADSRIIRFTEEPYKDFVITVKSDIVTVDNKTIQMKFRAEPDTFKLLGSNGDETDVIKQPESFGFKGNERMGSGRGYIWSRTLPMIKNAFFLGTGPDTYAVAFPQYDYIGKIKTYGKAQWIVDKPHNIFLQIASNTGMPSLIALLVLWGFYMIQSIRIYIKSADYSYIRLSGIGVFLGNLGYLVAGMFNDSVVGIAPIFWVLLGLGFVCNLLNKNQQTIMRPAK